MNDLRKELGIDDWLELVKENKNLDSAYISFAQYMDILEKENKLLKENLMESMLNSYSQGREYTKVVYEKQLKQRDEVIDECIEAIENFMTHIDDSFCADMMTFIDILNKCKGDNK